MIFGAEDLAAQRALADQHVLGPHAQHHLARAPRRRAGRHGDLGTPPRRRAVAPGASAPATGSRFIAGEPMKAATNRLAGRA
jgi:hypothetical protein